MLFLSVLIVGVLQVLFLDMFGMVLLGGWIEVGSLSQLPTQIHLAASLQPIATMLSLKKLQRKISRFF
jgi:hypothetical protein